MVYHGQYERNTYLMGDWMKHTPISLFLPCFECLLWWEGPFDGDSEQLKVETLENELECPFPSVVEVPAGIETR